MKNKRFIFEDVFIYLLIQVLPMEVIFMFLCNDLYNFKGFTLLNIMIFTVAQIVVFLLRWCGTISDNTIDYKEVKDKTDLYLYLKIRSCKILEAGNFVDFLNCIIFVSCIYYNPCSQLRLAFVLGLWLLMTGTRIYLFSTNYKIIKQVIADNKLKCKIPIFGFFGRFESFGRFSVIVSILTIVITVSIKMANMITFG